jgi:hypothetical protein
VQIGVLTINLQVQYIREDGCGARQGEAQVPVFPATWTGQTHCIGRRHDWQKLAVSWPGPLVASRAARRASCLIACARNAFFANAFAAIRIDHVE